MLSLKKKKATNNKYWQGCDKKRTYILCWRAYRLVQPLWKTVWSFLKKIKRELPYDPAIPFLDISKANKNTNSKTYRHTNVHSSIIYNAKDMKATCPSTDEWIKMWDIHTHIYIYTMEYYANYKKDEILPFATTWMELEGIILSKIMAQKKTSTARYHLFMESKK